MTYYYSHETKGFYNKEIHGNTMPKDCVAISDEKHMELLNRPADKEIGANLELVDIVIPEKVRIEEHNRAIYLEMDEVFIKLSRNYLRPSYKNSPKYNEYKLKYEQELKALEQKLEEI